MLLGEMLGSRDQGLTIKLSTVHCACVDNKGRRFDTNFSYFPNMLLFLPSFYFC